jgi:hypothetical protein
MTATLVPEGRFASIAANLGSLPSAFAQFQSDKDGKPSILRLTFASAQAYNFKVDVCFEGQSGSRQLVLSIFVASIGTKEYAGTIKLNANVGF